jgi:hypothetical protein
VTKKVKLPPGEYSKFAMSQLRLLHDVLGVQPEPVQTAALQGATVGVGSHRYSLILHPHKKVICSATHAPSGAVRCSMVRRTLLDASTSFCRFHASALVCALVRCACDEGHQGEALQADLIASGLIPRVAHLAFSSPHCSCLHTAFLEAFSIHTLVQMPRKMWEPLLLPNLGAPEGTSRTTLEALPDLLFRLGELSSDVAACTIVFLAGLSQYR